MRPSARGPATSRTPGTRTNCCQRTRILWRAPAAPASGANAAPTTSTAAVSLTALRRRLSDRRLRRRKPLDVRIDHQLDKVAEGDPRLPAERGASLRGVADQVVDLGRPQESRIRDHVPHRVHSGTLARDLDELANRMLISRRNDIVGWLVLLDHQPHRLHVVTGKPPITLGIEVAEPKLIGKA